jgi:hypothetical protein
MWITQRPRGPPIWVNSASLAEDSANFRRPLTGQHFAGDALEGLKCPLAPCVGWTHAVLWMGGMLR